MKNATASPPASSAWLEAAGYTVHLAGGGPAELARAVAGVHTGDLVLALEVTEETPYVARAMVYGLVRMLAQARPGRFGEVTARVGELTRRLTSEVVE